MSKGELINLIYVTRQDHLNSYGSRYEVEAIRYHNALACLWRSSASLSWYNCRDLSQAGERQIVKSQDKEKT